MSAIERVYALLVEADPVPDPAALPGRPEAAPHLRLLEHGRMTMQTTPTVERSTPTPPPRRRRLIPALAAAAVVSTLIAGAVAITRESREATPPATEAPQQPDDAARESAAVAKAVAYHEAINRGDLDALATLTSPEGELSEKDRNMYAFNAVSTADYPWELRGCEARGGTPGVTVRVECAILITDPVFIASGVGELIAPFDVYDSGLMVWFPWEGGADEAIIAYREYLQLNDPEGFDAACGSGSHDPTTVRFNAGMALAPACASLSVPLAAEIAAWVEAGKPGT
jgi:hypothetical protein